VQPSCEDPTELGTNRYGGSVRVLVAEDDAGLSSVLARGLRECGYAVDAVADGEEALAYLGAYEYDVLVLDWRMPKLSGLEVLDRLRRRGTKVPVLMLTARDSIEDKVRGLNSGADDYLVKPFSFEELLARIRALQRRPPITLPPVIGFGDLSFDPASRKVSAAERELDLTPTEMAILELLLRRAGQVVTRRQIATQVWEDEAQAVSSNTIEVHIGRLRSKLKGSTVRIETVRGLGYKLAAP